MVTCNGRAKQGFCMQMMCVNSEDINVIMEEVNK